LCGHLLREGFIFELQCSIDVEADYELVAVAFGNPRLVIVVIVEKVLRKSRLGTVVLILPSRDKLKLARKPEVDICAGQSQLHLQASKIVKAVPAHVECAGSISIACVPRLAKRRQYDVGSSEREEGEVETK
jgi:hypothetical protein